ncbi:nicotinate-nucleotide adenylyltransferase [Glycomyces xiaoerkulensis]|uniref:nicotinate-nucleotide adenylyltransferase n=1 Tax=Glycomyces xiaoerkulensis TaxID=2038139 RepID=UPI001E63185E|nr:nicotinate-nucleotide adenylyltransferase [Glycomyces xiaoerkulensis]
MHELPIHRVGIFGGTFDPPHLGHLVAASEAAHRCALDEVVFVPAGDPWQKNDRDVSDASARLTMTRLAIERDSRFRVSTCDIDREGHTYAIDTVADVRAEYTAPVDLNFVFGADSLENLHTWHRVEELYMAVKFIALNRRGHSRARVDTSSGIDVEFVDMPGVDVSSSECRRRVRVGEPVRYLVPEAVDAYIEEHRLYRS